MNIVKLIKWTTDNHHQFRLPICLFHYKDCTETIDIILPKTSQHFHPFYVKQTQNLMAEKNQSVLLCMRVVIAMSEMLLVSRLFSKKCTYPVPKDLI